MLTAKQEKFVQNIMAGMNQADAYRSAYNCSRMTDSSIYVNASKLINDPKVAQRLSELREQISTDNVMSAQKRLEWLTELIKNDDANTGDKLKAIDIMNKMQGEYVTKIDGSLNVTKLEDILWVVFEIQIFSNPKFGEIRTTAIDNEHWLVGQNVAQVFGYTNARKALENHVDIDDKGVKKCDIPGGMRELTITNEEETPG